MSLSFKWLSIKKVCVFFFGGGKGYMNLGYYDSKWWWSWWLLILVMTRFVGIYRCTPSDGSEEYCWRCLVFVFEILWRRWWWWWWSRCVYPHTHMWFFYHQIILWQIFGCSFFLILCSDMTSSLPLFLLRRRPCLHVCSSHPLYRRYSSP